MGDLYHAIADTLPDSVLDGQTGLNGQTAEENLDLVNWVLNQDFQSQGFTDAEVQSAIWDLMNTRSVPFFVPAGFGQSADAEFIYNQAIANGEGFSVFADGVLSDDEVIGLIIQPNPEVPDANEQPWIIGIPFEDLDCIC